MSLRFFSRHRRIGSIIVMAVVLALSLPAFGVLAQDLIAPIGQFNPTPSGQNLIPAFDGDYTPYRDQAIPFEQRRGNCCVEALFDELVGIDPEGGCLWNVGLQYSGQDALDQCKAIGGIHYVQGNLNMSQIEKPVSAYACGVQCGVLSNAYFCRPENNSCSQIPPTSGENVTMYPTQAACTDACTVPEDLETTIVSCRCDKGGGSVCSIDVVHNDELITPDTPARDALVESVTLTLDGPGTMSVRRTFLYDAAEDEDEDTEITAAYSADGNDLVLSGDGGFFRIPGAMTSEQTAGYRGGGFRAEILITQLTSDTNLQVVTEQRQTDPNQTNDWDWATVPVGEHCSDFTLETQCVLEYDGETLQEPGQYHTYSLAIEQRSNSDQNVLFSLDPNLEGSCLDSDTIYLPPYLEYDEDTGDGYCSVIDGFITCDVPAGTSADDVDMLWFTVQPLADNDCPVGIPIPVSATVTVPGQEPVVHTIYDKLEPCGQCEICGSITDENACYGMESPGDVNSVPFCSWEYVANAGGMRCVSNDDNPACSVWYAACMLDYEANPDDPDYDFFYAGRIGTNANDDPIYWPTQEAVASGMSEFYAGNEAIFTSAKDCWENNDQDYCDTVYRSHVPPDETFAYDEDPESYDGELALMYKACVGETAPETDRPNRYPRTVEPERNSDWYCSYFFMRPLNYSPVENSLTTPAAREPCEELRNQSLATGTAYDAGTYDQDDVDDPDDPSDDDLYLCPETCALVTMKWGTCYDPLTDTCEVGGPNNPEIDLNYCIDIGGMFFPSDDDACNRTCNNSLCDPGNIPEGWTAP